MFDLRKTHVHNKSALELEVDRIIQFGSSTVNVVSIPLLVSEAEVEFDDFVYKFYRLIQWRPAERFVENIIDDRLDEHLGIRYTLDFDSINRQALTDYKVTFIKHCNCFLKDWIDKLLIHSSDYLDQPEYWAMKVKLQDGKLGYIYPKKPLIKESETIYHAYFEFLYLGISTEDPLIRKLFN